MGKKNVHKPHIDPALLDEAIRRAGAANRARWHAIVGFHKAQLGGKGTRGTSVTVIDQETGARWERFQTARSKNALRKLALELVTEGVRALRG